MPTQIKFRPHHFLCTLGFMGLGYSPEFISNYRAISACLNGPSGDKEVIEVVNGADAICEPCPQRRGVSCVTQAKIARLDATHAQLLKLQIGDKITWGEAKQRMRVQVDAAQLEQACAGCEWLQSGMCQQALICLQSVNKD